MPKLYLRVLSDAEPLADGEGYDISVQWLLTENDGSVRGFGTTDQRGLADVADPHVEWLNDPQNTVVFVPAHFVLRVACEVPGRSPAQIRRALPFAVEEYVATDIETIHIAHGPIKARVPIQCNLIAREQIQNWLKCFQDIGVNAGTFVADSEVLTRDMDVASLLFENDTVLIAHGDEAAVIDRANLGFTLGNLDILKIIAANGRPTDLEVGQLQNAVEIEHHGAGEAGLIEYLVECYETHPPYINMLQGEFKAVRPRNAKVDRWRGVAALAAIWLVVAFLGMVVHAFWAESEADRLEAASFAFYEEVFPRESQPVGVDQLRRRMAAKLGQSADDGGDGQSAFVGLTAHLANSLTDRQRVTSISYAEQRGELSVEVMFRNYDEIDQLESKLSSIGIAVDRSTSEQESQGVRSRFRMRYQG